MWPPMYRSSMTVESVRDEVAYARSSSSSPRSGEVITCAWPVLMAKAVMITTSSRLLMIQVVYV